MPEKPRNENSPASEQAVYKADLKKIHEGTPGSPPGATVSLSASGQRSEGGKRIVEALREAVGGTEGC